jgi:hypothetical protein
MITKTDTIDPPSYEETFTQSLNGLQQQMAVYETAQRSGDEKVIEQEAPKVALAMRQVGDSHTDPKVKAEWHKKADKFIRCKGAARQGVLQDVGKVVVTVITMPFALTCCMMCATGSAIRGVGKFITGGEKDHSKETRKSFPRRIIFLFTPH